MNQTESRERIFQAKEANLTELYLNENKLTMLPAEIRQLFNLMELDPRSNQLTTFSRKHKLAQKDFFFPFTLKGAPASLFLNFNLAFRELK